MHSISVNTLWAELLEIKSIQRNKLCFRSSYAYVNFLSSNNNYKAVSSFYELTHGCRFCPSPVLWLLWISCFVVWSCQGRVEVMSWFRKALKYVLGSSSKTQPLWSKRIVFCLCILSKSTHFCRFWGRLLTGLLNWFYYYYCIYYIFLPFVFILAVFNTMLFSSPLFYCLNHDYPK